MALTPLTGALGIERAAHLLHRTTGGASKADVDIYANLTAQEAITRLFDAALPDTPLPLDPATGQEWVTTGAVEGVNNGDRELRGYFKSWFVGQMMAPDVDATQKLAFSFRERMVYFYHTHFTTIGEKVNSSRALYFQNALFRMYAFDKEDGQTEIINPETELPEIVDVPLNFKELAKKICIDNAMLVFLDGNLNVSGNPQENYAREMFELYTIGRGLEERVQNLAPSFEGDYFTFTEQDVQAAARVLTGWKYDKNFETLDEFTGLPRGRANRNQHYTDPQGKTFSSYFDNVAIDADPALLNGNNPTEESMLDELEKLITMIFSQEETARHICRKIYRFFAYHNITEDIDNTIIADLADIFIANNYKVQPVLEEFFQSREFYEGAAGVGDDKSGALIKSPLDLILSTYKFFNVQVPSYQTELENFYMVTGNMLNEMGDQGMHFYEPFEVAGYTAYFQFPQYNRNWISTTYLTKRYEFIRKVIRRDEGIPEVDPVAFVRTNFDGSAQDSKALIINLCSYMFPRSQNLNFDTDGGNITKERLRFFLQAFIQFSDYDNNDDVSMANIEWQSQYNTAANYLEAGVYLSRLFNSMMQSPEYQLF